MILRVTLSQNFAVKGKTRALGWNLEGDWLDHTGYTGTFIMYNPKEAGSCDLFV